MFQFSDESVQTGIETDLLTASGSFSDLIVYNDEVNTFDWVIQCLIEICDHGPEQAEQSAMIIHFKGKYCVKSGVFKEMKAMKDALNERGLNAVVERNQEA